MPGGLNILDLARSIATALTSNALNLRLVKVRLAIGGGTPGAMAIANAPFTVTRGKTPVASGSSSGNGEIQILMAVGETLSLHVLDTEYKVRIKSSLPAPNTTDGRQKRLDMVGFMTGHRRHPMGDAKPDDGIIGPRTQQAILLFQCDEGLSIEGTMDNTTQTRLVAATVV